MPSEYLEGTNAGLNPMTASPPLLTPKAATSALGGLCDLDCYRRSVFSKVDIQIGASVLFAPHCERPFQPYGGLS